MPRPLKGTALVRHQLDRLAEVLEGRIVLGKRGVGVAPVVVGGAVIRREGDGAVEVLHRLFGVAEIHQRVAAIVVDGGVLAARLDRLVEVVDRLLGLLQPPFGDAAVAIDARLDEIGDLRRGQCLVVRGDRPCRIAPRMQRGRALSRAEQGLVVLGGAGPCAANAARTVDEEPAA